MSTEENDKNQTTETSSKETKVKVEIGRSVELEALRKEKDDVIKAEKEAKETLENEKKQLLDEKKALEEEKQTLLTEKKTLEDSKTTVETELGEKKAILEQQALTEFENEKTKILTLIKDSKLTEDQKAEIEEKLQSPKNLEIVKSLVSMMAAAIKKPTDEEEKQKEKKPPAGKSTFIPPTNSEQFEDKIAMVDELYRRAYYQPQLYTKEQVNEAKTKIDVLFQTLINSKSWKQLKEGGIIPRQILVACPKCGRTYIGDDRPQDCGTCGWKLPIY